MYSEEATESECSATEEPPTPDDEKMLQPQDKGARASAQAQRAGQEEHSTDFTNTTSHGQGRAVQAAEELLTTPKK